METQSRRHNKGTSLAATLGLAAVCQLPRATSSRQCHGLWVFDRLWVVPVLVTAGSSLPAGMPECGVSCRAAGSTVRRGPRSLGRVCGVSAGQAGVLAMVMMAGAMRVTVSFAPACAKDEGDLDLRARCRSRSTTFRHFAISLVTAW